MGRSYRDTEGPPPCPSCRPGWHQKADSGWLLSVTPAAPTPRFPADPKLCDGTLRQTDVVVSSARWLPPGSVTKNVFGKGFTGAWAGCQGRRPGGGASATPSQSRSENDDQRTFTAAPATRRTGNLPRSSAPAEGSVGDTVLTASALVTAIPNSSAPDNGRKRHIVVDTLGLLIVVLVTAASLQDRDGGRRILDRARMAMPFDRAGLGRRWLRGQAGCLGRPGTAGSCSRSCENPEGQRTFEVLPRRWVVERTLRPEKVRGGSYVKPFFNGIRPAWQALRDAAVAAPIVHEILYYVLIGAASQPYVNAPEVRVLTGRDPKSPTWIDARRRTGFHPPAGTGRPLARVSAIRANRSLAAVPSCHVLRQLRLRRRALLGARRAAASPPGRRGHRTPFPPNEIPPC